MTAGAEPALFTYRVTPDKVPCTDGTTIVRLQVTVTNETGREVSCSQLGFTVPPGLTADPDAIAPSAVSGTPWSNTAAGGGAFTAEPEPPVASLQAGETIGFVFDHVAVTGPPGPAGLTVWEVTDATRQRVLDVAKVDAPLGITAFGASPVQVAPGGTARLSWSTTAADTATVSWAGRNQPVDRPSGSMPVTPLVTTTYTLVATGGTDSVSQQVTVSVARTQVISFRASPPAVALGESTTLHWHVLNARSCTVEPGGTVVDPVGGALPVTPTAPTSYVLQAVGDGVDNDDARPFVVDLRRVTATSFAADAADVPPGDPVRLRWATDGAGSVAIEPGPSGLPGTGTVEVHPATTTTYQLVAEGWLGPARRSVTVRVAPPSLTRVALDAADGRNAVVAWEAPVGDVTVDAGDGPRPVPATGTLVVPVGPSERTVVVATAKGSWTSAVELSVPATLGRITHVALTGPDGLGAAESTVVVEWAGRPTEAYMAVGQTSSRVTSRVLSGRDGGRTGLPTGPPVATGWLWTGGVGVDPKIWGVSIGWLVHGAGSTSPSGAWVPVVGSHPWVDRGAHPDDHYPADRSASP